MNEMKPADFALHIEKPTLVVNKERAHNNIKKMADKARKSGVRFKPHFKTHQSAAISDWFKEFDVNSITVSSVDMAGYFAEHGWKDITIAFPVNFLQIRKINKLAHEISLNLLAESGEAVSFLRRNVIKMYESGSRLMSDITGPELTATILKKFWTLCGTLKKRPTSFSAVFLPMRGIRMTSGQSTV